MSIIERIGNEFDVIIRESRDIGRRARVVAAEYFHRFSSYVSHTSAFCSLAGRLATTYRVESGFVDKCPQGTQRDMLSLWNTLSIATGIPASCVVNCVIGRAGNLESLGKQFDAWIDQNRQAINRIEGLKFTGHRELPSQLSQLTQLKELYLIEGNFKTLPPEVYSLPNLKKLVIQGCRNHISLGPEIGRLTQLTKLSIESVDGITLPGEIGSLQNLTELCISGPTIVRPEICRLYQLEKLHIRNCPLDGHIVTPFGSLAPLPWQIGNLSNLREAVFCNNGLRTVPDCLADLHEHCRFDFTGNRVPGEVLERQIAGLRAEAARRAERIEAARGVEAAAQAANFEAQIEDAGESFEQTLVLWLTEYQKNFSKFCENQSDRLPKDGACPAFYNSLLYHEERGKLSLFLERLKASKDYTDGGTSQIQLTRRVYRMLELAAADRHFCDTLFPLLHDACSTCHDRPALVFNRVEMQMELLTAKE
ncbi:MAG TPA: NEL-type E3 ubiquitin ligase domain-containing protein, partial [Rhabdochlamydiaceae bacterium]|nr:NEL-type E3 ubiquitin ligase domain-containing protein [Rhabdochlamydiaceae bacterium]